MLAQVREAARNGYTFFGIQGRVNESLVSPARGLQVRTTASGNLTANQVPMLSLATPGITAPLTYTITSLPSNGVLRDGANALITNVPYILTAPQVSYTPTTGFLGTDTFAFTVSNGTITSSAFGNIHVFLANCTNDVRGCNDGRQ